MGINTAAYKLRAFVLSALLAAMAGVFFTHYTGGIGPSEASAFKSVRYVALAASGGMASLWGVTGMSTLLNYLSLRGLFGSYDNAVFGVISYHHCFARAGRTAQAARAVGRAAGRDAFHRVPNETKKWGHGGTCPYHGYLT